MIGKKGLIMKFPMVEFKDTWFFLDVPIFHSRVFLYVGDDNGMMRTAESYIAELGHDDARMLGEYVKGELQKRTDEDYDTDGLSFGFNGNAFIRVSRLRTGNLDDLLLLNHECLHAANAILRHIELREDSNIEGLCYTHEYIVGGFLKQTMAIKTQDNDRHIVTENIIRE